MIITEVKIKLAEENRERLLGFCSITIDNQFAIRDIKIIDGVKGKFIAMPSRKLTDRCPRCGGKNHVLANFCNNCGEQLPADRATRSADGKIKIHADVAHPINGACREAVQRAILDEYAREVERAKQPSYTSNYEE